MQRVATYRGNVVQTHTLQRRRHRVCGAIHGGAALSSDGATVYVESHNKKVYAIDANNWTQEWAFQTGDWVSCSPELSSDGATVNHRWRRVIHALNSEAQNQHLTLPTPPPGAVHVRGCHASILAVVI